MHGVMERLPSWPGISDLFGWVSLGLPGVHSVPGLHGIRIEERVEDDTYVLSAELPGIDASKNVEISITGGVLTLRAERSAPTMDCRTEFHYGSFLRNIRLPAGARHEDATAEYADGVLVIRAPISKEESGTRTVTVRHG
ncbi:Hsp20/alpha crystallin family protein [Streptomyces sp. SID14478]|uniref:Hsp20/alpha crystallin family protein n=1 Tax=Streptomyces sp. SID14478 TaxID=2706073 RepID=UPI0013DB29B9|nr:Hsp20/alpha crystallin family protein [Streptomyces sp. SID14478]NEB74258.1 Hsp20/alpha crystallin family protein [Streptomyces sp. SID14478]